MLQWAFRYAAGLFCGTPATCPGADSVAMAVHLLSLAQVERLSFTLNFEPGILRFVGLVPSENGLPLQILTHPVDEGTVAVELTPPPGVLLPVGSHALVKVLFQVATAAISPWIPVRLLEGEYVDSTGTAIACNSPVGLIRVMGIPPALSLPTLRLVSPGDGEFVDALTTPFRWAALCPYPWYIDSQFELRLWPPLRTRSTARDFCEFPTTWLFSAEGPVGTYHKTVSVARRAGRFVCPDTFTMALPTPGPLQCASLQSRCILPLDPSERIQGLAVAGPFLYVLVRDTTAPSKYAGWKVAVVAVHQDSCQVWNVQEIRDASEKDPSAIGNDRAFFVYAPVLYWYSLSPDKVFTFRSFLSSSWPFRDLVICGDYVVVLSEKSEGGSIIVYDASGLGRGKHAITVPLLGWRLPSSLVAERIDGLLFIPPYLYVASGDWGVFDMYTPEMPQLVAHVADAGGVKGITAMGNRLCTWGADGTVRVYDICEPGSPRLPHSERVGEVWSVVCLENCCVCSTREAYALPSPHRGPLRLRGFFLCSFSRLATSGSHLNVPSAGDGLIEVYRNLKTGVVHETNKGVEAQLAIEGAYPNPCNATSRLHLSLPSKEPVSVAVVNGRGGRCCAGSGKECARLEVGKMVTTRKLLLVRLRAGHAL